MTPRSNNYTLIYFVIQAFALNYTLLYNEFGDYMLSIKDNTENIYIIKKSKFICLLYKVNNIDEINNILNNVKLKYKDATHICYAYICEEKIKCNDDGEPSGTAGLPIYNVLTNNNLDHVLCIVIRYFGGIKLGAGGLVRAYSTSVVEALNKTEIAELKHGINLKIEFNYDLTKQIDYLLKNCIILNKEYKSNVIYNINITLDNYNNIENELKNLCINLTIIKSILI